MWDSLYVWRRTIRSWIGKRLSTGRYLLSTNSICHARIGLWLVDLLCFFFCFGFRNDRTIDLVDFFCNFSISNKNFLLYSKQSYRFYISVGFWLSFKGSPQKMKLQRWLYSLSSFIQYSLFSFIFVQIMWVAVGKTELKGFPTWM